MRLFLPIILIGLLYINTADASENDDTRLVLLGTGTPNAEPDRSGPSLAIIVKDQSYIVDFGPGIVRQANKLYTQDNDAYLSLKPSNLKVAFLTHLHSDHTTGCLLYTSPSPRDATLSRMPSSA